MENTKNTISLTNQNKGNVSYCKKHKCINKKLWSLLFFIVIVTLFSGCRKKEDVKETIFYESVTNEKNNDVKEELNTTTSPYVIYEEDNPYNNSPPDSYGWYVKAKYDWKEDEDGTVWYQGRHFKRNNYIKCILAVGIDRSNGIKNNPGNIYENGQSDAIFVIAQDTARNTVNILMCPRDAITEITITDENGENGHAEIDHLLLAWGFGDGAEKSIQNVVNAVSGMLCGLHVDHYAFADISMINEVNDLVGGTTVTVPNSELEKVNKAWKEGTEITLHGKDAERFIRYRDLNEANSAIYRMQQHRAYIIGFEKQLKNQAKKDSNIITKLCDFCYEKMMTDLNKTEYKKLSLDLLYAKDIADNNITTLPGKAVAATDDYLWDRIYIDYQRAIPIILEMFYREM